MLVEAAIFCRVEIDAYCFMPDHLHVLATSTGQDARKFMNRFKQRTGYWFRRTTGQQLWQKSYYDHVIRSDEDMERIAEYILDNPVRAGLCISWEEYAHSWSRWYSRSGDL